MNKYIVLLRGINVGGKNKLPMAELRTLLSENGYENVSTYIQSGNIFLNSTKTVDKINVHIKQLLKQQLGYDIPVVTLTAEEIKTCYTENPFLKIEDNIKNLHVTFLNTAPEKGSIEHFTLNNNNNNNDAYSIEGRIIYLHTPDGYRNTKFTNGEFEKKLKVQATTRNWRTTTKLFELSGL